MRTENNIRARESDGTSRVSSSPITENRDRCGSQRIIALEFCILSKKWMQSKYSVTSGIETLFERVDNISTTVILIRATHSYRGYSDTCW